MDNNTDHSMDHMDKKPRSGGFYSHGGTVIMDGFFHGKSHLKMDDDSGVTP